ncbi:RNA polymerase sigma factor FliA [Porticoccaceae bacterium]|jgi:RNA polymerase sigma factor for flagellar operon FliA|nr:RNA polymerase sigma factor FliA [Porticoccus sp.]MDB3884810.1 RNA polymerase sigma factor FliA [Porticoccaceae bacterium]MDC3199572.1 RNA polymerase sigma factor FliA [Porticoccaceae bacterium]
MADLGLYDEVRRASQNNDELMQHIGLVKRVALHLKTRLPNFMELDELIQVGTIGLIEAAKSFDDSKGVEFEVFARTRIRGAILDQVRKLSYLPRSAIANIRDHNEATSMLSGELGREPSQSELADFMGKDLDSFHKERTHAYRFQTVSLESQLPDTVDMPSADLNEPEANLEGGQMLEALAGSIESLPEREKTIVSLYYVEEMNLKEIGAVLDLSESRVSQILSSTIKLLRQDLAEE